MSNEIQFPFQNRELSWLDFNDRVLEEAFNKENPLMERIKFLAITGSNLDEFFMVRIAGVKEKVLNKIKKRDDSGLTPDELLAKLEDKAYNFMDKQYNCFNRSLLPELKKYNINFINTESATKTQLKQIDEYFDKILSPVLTPLAIDNSRPFPMLATKTLNIAVRLEDREQKESCFAIVQVPSILPRFIKLKSEDDVSDYILLENIIMSKLNKLFEYHDIISSTPFRVTRNSGLSIDEDAEDFLWEMENFVKKRKKGRPVRLEIFNKADNKTKKFLCKMLEIDDNSIYLAKGPLDLTFLMKFSGAEKNSEFHFEPASPVSPAPDFYGVDDIFSAIKERDRMVHHPYESFDCVVNFVQTAAEDEDVLAIKQTLYRVSGNSPIIAALIKAAEAGKQVTVLVELKARFDEENNIVWAKKLEDAGCHVIYGLSGLKTHCKITLVVRQEEDGIKRYMHMGTGNYNDSTAKIYTDFSLFTCNDKFGADASSLFNVLTGYSKPPVYNHIVVAPHGLRNFFIRMIRNEAENAKKGLPSYIMIKINSLIDTEMIKELYKASMAGTKITLVVRGICGLITGIPGISENITVKSIVGRYLEHSRVFIFGNAGAPKYYLGSADLMQRNLDRRIELVFPIECEELKERIKHTFEIHDNDTTNARVMSSDTSYDHIDLRGKIRLNSQEYFASEAQERLKQLQEVEKDSPLIPIHSAE